MNSTKNLKDERCFEKFGTLEIEDYNKEFLMRTNASNIGIRDVLLQKNVKGECMLVRCAFEKFAPTEVRYGISEKEMYAVFRV